MQQEQSRAVLRIRDLPVRMTVFSMLRAMLSKRLVNTAS
jgi:hypothetical protein